MLHWSNLEFEVESSQINAVYNIPSDCLHLRVVESREDMSVTGGVGALLDPLLTKQVLIIKAQREGFDVTFSALTVGMTYKILTRWRSSAIQESFERGEIDSYQDFFLKESR